MNNYARTISPENNLPEFGEMMLLGQYYLVSNDLGIEALFLINSSGFFPNV